MSTLAARRTDPAVRADPGGTWYVIRTAPRRVKELRTEARRLGVEIFFPEYVRVDRAGKPGGPRKEVHSFKPVFPGYAFVRRDDVKHLRRLPGDLRFRFQFLRSYGDRYAEVWPKVIEEMRAQTEEWCRIGPKPGPSDLFEVGQRVKIQGDLFPPARVVWIGDASVKVESELGPIEVAPEMLSVVKG
jgi:transcription antitermination factor NusG